MGAKKTEIFHFFCRSSVLFFVATYRNDLISVGDHKKNTDLRNCSPRLFRSTVQNLPLRTRCAQGGQITATLRTRCAQGGPHFQISNSGAIDDLDGPVFHGPPSHFCVFFSFTRPAHGEAHTKKKRKNGRGSEQIFVIRFRIVVVP